MAEILPELAPLRELRKTLSRLHPDKLQVGRDGCNRCLISPFRSKTGRNQPSNSKYVFGQAAWVRHLIKPPPGYGVAYIDYEQQEFGVAAALSGDPAMMAAYRSGDSYLAFAKQLPERHHRLYRQFWNWSANVIDHAKLKHSIETRLWLAAMGGLPNQPPQSAQFPDASQWRGNAATRDLHSNRSGFLDWRTSA